MMHLFYEVRERHKQNKIVHAWIEEAGSDVKASVAVVLFSQSLFLSR